MNAKWRQRLHLEPPKGWLNDPNGLCFYNGNYHIYFQYDPFSADGAGKKCWGHYKSPDMLNWEFTGTVLTPDIYEDKDGVYSGSAIIKDGIMHLFYTGNVKKDGNYDYILNGRGANVIHVTSVDGHNMSAKEVILKNNDYPEFCSCHVRDPKLWYENGIYYMVLGARTKENEGCILFYSSSDLEEWKFSGEYSIPDFGYMWECPDCFTMDNQRYISISPQGLEHEEFKNQNVYSSGYLTEGKFIEWDYGFDFYAPQTFETPDNRRILIGWFGIGDIDYENPTAELGWQHCLTIPREIKRLKDGTLVQMPMCEYTSLRYEKINADNNSTVQIPLPFDLSAKITGDFEISINTSLVLKLDDNVFSMEFKDKSLGYGRSIRHVKMEGCQDIRIIADMSSLEVFLDGGKYVMSTRFYPTDNNIEIKLNGLKADIYKMHRMEMYINGE